MTERTGTTDNELDAAFEGPAPYCNKFVLNASMSAVRIAFLEAWQASEDSPTRLAQRAAVTLSFDDARALKEVLSRMLEDLSGIQLTSASQAE